MAFVIVANLDDLEPGETLFVEELREPICLVRLDDDDVRAVHNTCTHQQQPLHEGTVQDDDTLVCASHNSRFDLTTGESVGIPVIASGGAGTVGHFVDVFARGKADAALAASIFHFGVSSARSLKEELARAGVSVRLPC